MRILRPGLLVGLLLTGRLLAADAPPAGPSNFREEFWPAVVDAVPKLLASQDKSTGRFGNKPWVVNDQHAMWPLAVAWGTDRPGNPYDHSAQVLDAIMKGG